MQPEERKRNRRQKCSLNTRFNYRDEQLLEVLRSHLQDSDWITISTLSRLRLRSILKLDILMQTHSQTVCDFRYEDEDVR